MNPDDRLRVDRLVLEAAALEPAEREAFLDGLSPAERHVADEVRRRLEAARDLPDDFLSSPATEILEAACGWPHGDSEAPEPPAGDERYEIRECLGSGGMARVYSALDRRLGRRVALKILHGSDPETPRRLLAEARAQARVRHDHVLEVYETGELNGRPYIAVRHVDGGTLAELDDGVSLEQRVRLMAQAAEGLHAAHREGLLHGDVKPSNVMVETTPDGDLVARIGDFGIATELAGDRAEPAGLAGTPELMAPELLRGDRGAADRRSDVFSLGATLHQVLLEELPAHESTSLRDLRERAPSLPADLAAILARCLAENPAERYPSARAVSEDLRRFLDGDVVEAYADRLAYRITRFAARHRALLTVAGVSAVLLALALVVAAVMGVRAVHAGALAEKRQAQAEDLIGFMLLDLRDKLEPVGRLDLLDDVGEHAMRYFAAVPEDQLSDEELARRATALHQIGAVRMRQGDLAGAQQPFEESLALSRRLAERDPGNAERLFGLGQSEFWLGYAHWERGDLAAARRHFEEYRSISERLVARDPDHRAWRRELSYAHSNLGSLLQAEGDLNGALERFRAALAIDRRLAEEARSRSRGRDGDRPDPSDEPLFELAASHNTVGLVLEQLGRLEEAQEHFEADLALRRELLERDPDNRRWREFLGTSHQYLGHLLLARGDPAAASPHLETAHEILDALAAHDPDNGDWLYKSALSSLHLGRLRHEQGRREEAGTAWHRAHELARGLARRDPERADWRLLLGSTHHHLARWALQGESPDLEEARARSERALEILGPGAGDRTRNRHARRWLVESLVLRGELETVAGDPDAAERAWQRTAAVLGPELDAGSRHPDLVNARERLRDHLESSRVTPTPTGPNGAGGTDPDEPTDRRNP